MSYEGACSTLTGSASGVDVYITLAFGDDVKHVPAERPDDSANCTGIGQ